MRNHNRKICAVFLASILGIGSITACGVKNEATTKEENTSQSEEGTSDYEYSSEDIDASYDKESATKITFEGDKILVDGTGTSVSGSTLTINKSGTYILSGTLNDGQVIVSANKEDTIRLVLNEVNLNCSTSSAIYCEQSKKVIIILEEGTSNTVSDATSYVYENEEDTEPDAAIFSKDDLIFTGTGKINVTANYYNAIQSKDNLVITQGTFNITAINNTIQGKDSITILDGNFTLDAKHNAIHSKGNLKIEGGTFSIKAVKKGVHADALVTVNAGEINVEESFEGIEGLSITINGGEINLVSSDDGLNVANQDDTTTTSDMPDIPEDLQMMEQPTNVDGNFNPPQINDSSTEDEAVENQDLNQRKPDQMPQNDGQMPQKGGPMGGGFDQVEEDCVITITGGKITIDAGGDGIDSNGHIYMTGGEVYVNGPINDGNGAIDYNGEFNISGGTLIAIGSAGMAQTVSETSTQNALEIIYTSIQQAGSKVGLMDSNGNEIISFESIKDYQSIVISAPNLKEAKTYTLTTNGTKLGEITLSGRSTVTDETGQTVSQTIMGPQRGRGGQMPQVDQMPEYGQIPDAEEINPSQESKDNTTT